MLDEPHMLRESRVALEGLEIHFPNLEQPIENLSGGQRQAVAIARAVYWDAKLMIMDEPTNNLGVPEQHKVLELIRKLRDQGVPVILITHTLPDVFAVSDRLIVMHRGRKVTEKRTDGDQHAGAGAVHGGRARRYARPVSGAARFPDDRAGEPAARSRRTNACGKREPRRRSRSGRPLGAQLAFNRGGAEPHGLGAAAVCARSGEELSSGLRPSAPSPRNRR